MKTILTATLAALALALPAGAREVINPSEPMVLLPGLEFLGYSRLSTVEHCEALTGVADYSNLVTDYELESMEACLVEHT
jgi:hypothetical protein